MLIVSLCFYTIAGYGKRAKQSSTPLVFSPNSNQVKWEVNSDNEKLLFRYIEFGKFDLFRALIESGESVNTRLEQNGKTLLCESTEFNRIDFVKYLLKKGADPELRGSWGNTICSATQYYRPEIVSLLLEHGVDPDTKTNDGCPIIIFAVSENHYKSVKLLIDYKVDVNAVSRHGETALERTKDNPEMRNILVDAGAKK